MKIAMILDTDFPPDARVENEARSLVENGKHDIYLFSLSYKPFTISKEKTRLINVQRYRASLMIYKLSALAHDLPFYRYLVSKKIKDFLLEVNPDAIHVHDMVIAYTVYKVARKMEIPLILDLHENRPEIMQYYPHLSSFPGKLLINLNRWRKVQMKLITKYDKVVVVTQEAKKYYLDHSKEKASKFIEVPNTLFPDRFLVRDRSIEKHYSESFTVVYIGDTGIRRGTLFALKSIPILISKIKNLKMVLVGDSSENSILKEYINDNELNNYVDMVGWKDPNLLPSYIQAADICISPLQRNLHHDTTFANKIFQYMAMAKPILVSDCPPQKRIAEDYNCGLAYKADSLDDYTEKVLFLYHDMDLRKNLGENGKKAILTDLNFENTSSGLQAYYSTTHSKNKG